MTESKPGVVRWPSVHLLSSIFRPQSVVCSPLSCGLFPKAVEFDCRRALLPCVAFVAETTICEANNKTLGDQLVAGLGSLTRSSAYLSLAPGVLLLGGLSSSFQLCFLCGEVLLRSPAEPRSAYARSLSLPFFRQVFEFQERWVSL